MFKFYNKRDVDRHVSQMSQKLNENERSIKGFSIAKCYAKVNEYDLARDWLQRYLNIKTEDSAAHRLMGEILERLHKTEEAITSYQRSYNLNPRQNDIIKHVCRLFLINGSWSTYLGKVKYWCELAETENIRDENVANLRLKVASKDKKGDNKELQSELSGSLTEDFTLNNTSQNGYTDEEIFHNASSSSFKGNRESAISFAPMPNYNEKFNDIEGLVRKLSDLVISVKDDVLCVRNDITSLRDDILNIRGDITDMNVNKDSTTTKAFNDVFKSVEDLSWNVSYMMNFVSSTTGSIPPNLNMRFAAPQHQFNQMYNTAYPIYGPPPPPMQFPGIQPTRSAMPPQMPAHLQYADPHAMNLIMNASNYNTPIIASPQLQQQQQQQQQHQQPQVQIQQVQPTAVLNGQKSSLLEALNTSSVLNTWNNTYNPAIPTHPSTMPQHIMQQQSNIIVSTPNVPVIASTPMVPNINKPVEKIPVNVVITSSDPLPTQNSIVNQPTLSVTIPPQHIKHAPSFVPPLPPPQQQPPQPSQPSTLVSTPTAKIVKEKKSDKNKPAQSSPFANFSFGGSSNKSFTELFGNINSNKIESSVPTQSLSSASPSKVNTSTHNEEDVDHFEPTAQFEPVIPLPDLVDAKTGEEDENVVFCHRAKLLRFDTSTKEWKDRGIGEIKILVTKSDATKARLLMRREQVLKVCLNMPITKELKFSARNSTAASFGGQDFSEGEMRTETLTIKFKTADLLKSFQDAVQDVQKKFGDVKSNAPEKKKVEKAKKAEKAKKEETKGFGDQFKPKAGSWTCEACYISNKPDVLYCVACESPKDSTVPKKEAKSILAPSADAPKFSFGMPATGSGFSFGMPTLSAAATATSTSSTQVSTTTQSQTSISFGTATLPNFTFGTGLSSPATTTSSSGFTFGSMSPSAATATVMSSTEVTSTTSTVTAATETATATGGFKFGASKTFSFGNDTLIAKPTPVEVETITSGELLRNTDSGFNFIFKKKSPTKSPGKSRNDSVNSEGGGEDANENEYHEEEENQTYFAPVIPLPEKVEVKTGEEDEILLYSHRAKLFRFADQEWKERGVGDVKILRHKETSKLRIVMRRDQIYKICLNFFLDADIEFKRKDDTSWSFAANDFSEGEYEPRSFAIRFKNKDICDGFKKAIDDALAGKSEEILMPSSTDESSDITKRLMLPDDFFNYLNSPDCPGCLGCKPDEFVFEKELTLEELLVIVDKAPLPLESPPKIVKNKSRRASQEKRVSFMLAEKKSNEKVAELLGESKDNELIGSKAKVDLFGIKKSEATTNIFAQFNAENPQQPATSTPPTPSVFGSSSQSIFGDSKNNSSSVFGTGSSSIFSSSLNTTPTTTGDKIKSGDQSNNSSSNVSLFGNKKNFSFGSVSNGGSSIFGGENKTPAFGSNIFGSALNNSNSESKSNDNISRNIFGTSSSSSFSFAEAAKELDKSKQDVGEPEFLKNTNTISGFAELAAAASPKNAFSGLNSSGGATTGGFFGLTVKEDFFSKNLNKQNASDNAVDTSQNDSENVQDDNYDPHYEPIIALPDEIKVSTGEEEEEKLFGERAKLYRYDVNTKEWKERGVGEMKILHHAKNNTYRMLLRREQIFKLVLNQLITPDLHMSPMENSLKAFCWAGLNYVEGSAEAEQLAIRFKNEDLANNFKKMIEDCQSKMESLENLHPEND